MSSIIREMKDFCILLHFSFTPWAHVFLDHFLFFYQGLPRPIFLTCHAQEGHHRMTKKDFSLSFHSTPRRNARSGLVDILARDNVLLNLLSIGYSPIIPLHLTLGSALPNCDLPRGFLTNYLRAKYPCKPPGETINFAFTQLDTEELESLNDVISEGSLLSDA